MPHQIDYTGRLRRQFLCLAALLAIEALAFYVQLQHQIVSFYPMNFDQTAYINSARMLCATYIGNGWIAFIHAILSLPYATGGGLMAQGALLCIIGGPSRTALLSLNLIYFLVLQFVLFRVVLKKTNETGGAWLAIAFLLPLSTIFNVAGGIYDFRVDFVVFCLFGIWACLIIESHIFKEQMPALFAAVVAIDLIWTRYVTVVYFILILFGLLVVFLYTGHNHIELPNSPAKRRIQNLAISGSMIAFVVLPMLVVNVRSIYEKYIVGHVLSDEKYIRAEELNLHSATEHLLYYLRSILLDHIGRYSLYFIGSVSILVVIAAMARRRMTPLLTLDRRLLDLVFLFLSIFVPIAVLTIDIAKSQVVGGIVVVPMLLAAVVLLPHKFASEIDCRRGGDHHRDQFWAIAPKCPSTVILFLIVIFGLGGFLANAAAKQHRLSRIDLDHVNEINRRIAQYLIENAVTSPRLFIDRLVDYLYGGTVTLFGFEQFGQVVDFARSNEQDFGIFAISRETALDLLARSDVAVITDPIRGRNSSYPMEINI